MNQYSSVFDAFSPLSTGRLVVLVPADLKYGTAIQRIWQLATTTGRCVLLLSLCNTIVEEPSLRRQLILMSALMENNNISTEVKVEIRRDWIDAVKRNYQRGDMIVCFAEHRDKLIQKPLNQILEANLDAPVYIISGRYTQKNPGSRWIAHAIRWTGWIGIILGFFWLQTRIALLPVDWRYTTLLVLATICEFGLILAWNNLIQ